MACAIVAFLYTCSCSDSLDQSVLLFCNLWNDIFIVPQLKLIMDLIQVGVSVTGSKKKNPLCQSQGGPCMGLAAAAAGRCFLHLYMITKHIIRGRDQV